MEFSLEINSFIDDYIKCIKEGSAAKWLNLVELLFLF